MPETPPPTILVFDSGVGGLTVFREAKTARPDAAFVYLADDAGFPYGNQPEDKLIARIAPILVPIQQTQLLINGYTDNVPIGPELKARGIRNNEELSLKRAQAVADFLIAQGVKSNLVYVKGFGDANPVASNDTPAGRAKNRRVEITLNGPGN